MEYRFIETMPQLIYDDFVKNHKHCHLLQSSSWSQVKTNWRHYLTGLEDANGNLVAAGLILIRATPLGQVLWYLPKGPVLDYDDDAIRDAYLNGLAKFARKKRATFVRIDPPIIRRSLKLHEYPGTPEPDIPQHIQNFEKLGFIHQGFTEQMGQTIQPRYQAINFYDKDYLKNLPARTRKMVRDTKNRYGVIEREGRDSLEEFADLIEQTAENKDVFLRGRSYFEKLWNAYPDDVYLYMARIDVEHALEETNQKKADIEQQIEDLQQNAPKKLHQLKEQLASYQIQIDLLEERLKDGGRYQALAGTMAVAFGTHLEILYSGRDFHWDRIPAQYAIYVQVMSEAFDRGIQTISTGGVEGTLDDGLTLYKNSFNPNIVETIGEFDLPIKKLLYKGMRTALRLRNKLVRQ